MWLCYLRNNAPSQLKGCTEKGKSEHLYWHTYLSVMWKYHYNAEVCSSFPAQIQVSTWLWMGIMKHSPGDRHKSGPIPQERLWKVSPDSARKHVLQSHYWRQTILRVAWYAHFGPVGPIAQEVGHWTVRSYGPAVHSCYQVLCFGSFEQLVISETKREWWHREGKEVRYQLLRSHGDDCKISLVSKRSTVFLSVVARLVCLSVLAHGIQEMDVSSITSICF